MKRARKIVLLSAGLWMFLFVLFAETSGAASVGLALFAVMFLLSGLFYLRPHVLLYLIERLTGR